MSVSDICIRRPVFTWVLMAIPVVLGIVAYFELGVDLFPKVDFPVVSIQAALPGASAEEMESSVTKPLEEVVISISGIDELRSITREGQSTIIVRFVLEKDGDVGAQEVRDKIASIQNALPEGVDTPLVNKFDLDANPIITIGISAAATCAKSPRSPSGRFRNRCKRLRVLAMCSCRADAVARSTCASIWTGWLPSDYRLRMCAARCKTQNLEIPGGIVDQGQRELVLRTLGRVDTSEKFNDLIIANRGNYSIRIRDVGVAEDSIEEPRGAQSAGRTERSFALCAETIGNQHG